MKLIVGLGNPGEEYNNTRHNIGFEVLDLYAIKKNTDFNTEKFSGKTAIFNYNGEKVILLKPLKYMNLSGEVVKKYIDYFKLEIDDVLVISDDLDLEIGRYKIKPKGSCGGHNGLRNIELNIGTNEYKRIKIGISNNKEVNTKNYVLGKFRGEQKDMIDSIKLNISNMLDDYLELSFDKFMNKYNGA